MFLRNALSYIWTCIRSTCKFSWLLKHTVLRVSQSLLCPSLLLFFFFFSLSSENVFIRTSLFKSNKRDILHFRLRKKNLWVEFSIAENAANQLFRCIVTIHHYYFSSPKPTTSSCFADTNLRIYDEFYSIICPVFIFMCTFKSLTFLALRKIQT